MSDSFGPESSAQSVVSVILGHGRVIFFGEEAIDNFNFCENDLTASKG